MALSIKKYLKIIAIGTKMRRKYKLFETQNIEKIDQICDPNKYHSMPLIFKE